jgi:hypothetical protein
MSARDVTQYGVLQAIAEFDRVGRDAFLDQYGFGPATGYFLVHDGRDYDSKAIVGVAHAFDLPEMGPLSAADFSGGDATVARLLRDLGFEVRSPKRNPPWSHDELVLALDLYQRLGMPSKSHPEVIELSQILNSLPAHRDRPDRERFRNVNGVALKLANFARLDPNYQGVGMTRGAKLEVEIWDRYAGDEDELRLAARRIRDGVAVPDATQTRQLRVSSIPIETRHQETYTATVSEGEIEAVRREQELVEAFDEFLRDAGHVTGRHQYETGDVRMYSDLFDDTDKVLYEAKGRLTRQAVRMALGQLIDYGRFEDPGVRGAVLLPRKPDDDLFALIEAGGVGVAWRTENAFESRWL